VSRREQQHQQVALEAQRILEQLLTCVGAGSPRQALLADLARADLGRRLAEADPYRDQADPPSSPVRAWDAEVQRIVAELEAQPLPAEEHPEPWAFEA
jgi:hypothetical protein